MIIKTQKINKEAFEALVKINKIVGRFRKHYPEIKQKETQILSSEEGALKIIKRVDGIIKNYDGKNAVKKLKNLIGFLAKEIKNL